MKMSKLKTRQIAGIAILTALYCVLSAMMKIPFIGAISLDLGYIALTVGCALFGPWAAVIGAVGCALESMLFSPYGFSISWFVANLIIGIGCGFVFKKTDNIWARIAAIVGFVAVGMLGAKTGIECYLYHIPFAIKIVKNAVAVGVDTLTMLVGLGITAKVIKYWK